MLDIPATIGYLRGTVGSQLVSFVTFDTDRLTTMLWRTGIVIPPGIIIDRLCLTEQLVRHIARLNRSTDPARAWLLGLTIETQSNTFISPAEAIRMGDFDAARQAVNQLTKKDGAAHG